MGALSTFPHPYLLLTLYEGYPFFVVSPSPARETLKATKVKIVTFKYFDIWEQ